MIAISLLVPQTHRPEVRQSFDTAYTTTLGPMVSKAANEELKKAVLCVLLLWAVSALATTAASRGLQPGGLELAPVASGDLDTKLYAWSDGAYDRHQRALLDNGYNGTSGGPCGPPNKAGESCSPSCDTPCVGGAMPITCLPTLCR
jgi:hypothetical protein